MRDGSIAHPMKPINIQNKIDPDMTLVCLMGSKSKGHFGFKVKFDATSSPTREEITSSGFHVISSLLRQPGTLKWPSERYRPGGY